MTEQDNSRWTPRQDDHLVEPFFAGLDQSPAPPTEFERELDPFGDEAGPPSSLQSGSIPLRWIWVFLVGGAGALWILW